ncbi:ATP-binding protein [Ramlibacter humi]|uniref:Bacterial transcriptional activator domain-containing protein n=1 Tax=Ramlibacter humi TaxID=2530451 RepID=A0A4Z0BFF7_9BURK|nr:BTAD domain-containing putative transcriptional regulator [Ramlibacter humi]TFY97047.1 hypothetical protein EZ216_19475 [Ramlibacter humi]
MQDDGASAVDRSKDIEDKPRQDDLRLFGAPTLRLAGGVSAPLEWPRGAALLAYLAAHPAWHLREKLAGLVRPDADTATAKTYLRAIIHRVRHTFPGMTGLEVEDDRVRWAGGSDVQRFRDAVAASDWERAIDVQRAPLLSRAAHCGLARLDEQLGSERSRLQQSLRAAMIALITQRRQQHADCSGLMCRLVAEDPMDENGVQFVLAHAATPLERHAAAAAFADLQRLLAHELGQQPLAATVALYGRMQDAAAASAAKTAPRAPAPTAAASPAPPLGRERDLASLVGTVRELKAPLLTIAGFGGAGKTMLARALFDTLAAQGHECAWVELLAADSLQTLLDATSTQLGVPAPEGSAEDHLARWLAGRTLTVFLDNFEQLVPHAQVLDRLLRAAPRVQFVVTSREVLRLPREHVLRLDGLACDGADSPAARLFALHAERAGYRVDVADSRAVAAIAGHLDGLPLAIELAAHWATLLEPEAILAELRSDAGFLDGASAAAMGQTRSMQSVLNSTWQRLEPIEQDMLTGLAVFMGPMELDQAREVSGADAPVLLGLVHRSLLQRSGVSGFRLHPLLRDYAKHRGRAGVLAQARQAHSAFFLEKVACATSLHFGCGMSEAARALAARIEDILKAWRFAVAAGDLRVLGTALPRLSVLLLMTARYEEAAQLCGDAAARLQDRSIGADLAALHAAACVRLGRMGEARTIARAALDAGCGGTARSWLESTLARLDWFESDYASALAHAHRALEGLPEDAVFFRIHALQEAAHARFGLDDVQEGRRELALSLELARAHKAQYLEARSLCHLAALCNGSGQGAEALGHLERALQIFDGPGFAYDTAFALRCRSYSLFILGQPAAQLESARTSLDTFRSAGYLHELGECWFALGLALQMNKAAEAAHAYGAALAQSMQAKNIAVALRALSFLGIMALPDDRPWGIALACFATMRPESRRPDRAIVRKLLLRHGVSEAEIEQGARESADWVLDEVHARALARLRSLDASAAGALL